MPDTPAQPSVRQSVLEAIQRDLTNPASAVRQAVEASGQGEELPQPRDPQSGQFVAPAAGDPPVAGEESPPADAGPGQEVPPGPVASAPAAPSGSTPESPTAATAPPAPPSPSPTAAPGPEANPFADYDEVEYQDPELGENIKVWAPKDKAARVKDGYALKAAMSRHATYLGRHKQFLEPLITSGQFDQLAPYIQRAITDPVFAQQLYLVATGQLQQAQPQPQPQPQPQAAQPPVADVEQTVAAMRQSLAAQGVDEYTTEAVISAQRPVIEAQVRQARELADWRQQQEVARQQQVAMQRAQQQVTWTLHQASQQLAYRYPNEFSGDPTRDEAKMTELFQWAKAAGLDQVYGVNPALFVVAKQDLEAKRASTAPAATPTSDLAQAARAAAAQAGTAIAQRAAATVVNQNPAQPPPAAPKDPLKAIDTKGKSIKQVAREVANAIK